MRPAGNSAFWSSADDVFLSPTSHLTLPGLQRAAKGAAVGSGIAVARRLEAGARSLGEAPSRGFRARRLGTTAHSQVLPFRRRKRHRCFGVCSSRFGPQRPYRDFCIAVVEHRSQARAASREVRPHCRSTNRIHERDDGDRVSRRRSRLPYLCIRRSPDGGCWLASAG